MRAQDPLEKFIRKSVDEIQYKGSEQMWENYAKDKQFGGKNKFPNYLMSSILIVAVVFGLTQLFLNKTGPESIAATNAATELEHSGSTKSAISANEENNLTTNHLSNIKTEATVAVTAATTDPTQELNKMKTVGNGKIGNQGRNSELNTGLLSQKGSEDDAYKSAASLTETSNSNVSVKQDNLTESRADIYSSEGKGNVSAGNEKDASLNKLLNSSSLKSSAEEINSTNANAASSEATTAINQAAKSKGNEQEINNKLSTVVPTSNIQSTFDLDYLSTELFTLSQNYSISDKVSNISFDELTRSPNRLSINLQSHGSFNRIFQYGVGASYEFRTLNKNSVSLQVEYLKEMGNNIIQDTITNFSSGSIISNRVSKDLNQIHNLNILALYNFEINKRLTLSGGPRVRLITGHGFKFEEENIYAFSRTTRRTGNYKDWNLINRIRVDGLLELKYLVFTQWQIGVAVSKSFTPLMRGSLATTNKSNQPFMFGVKLHYILNK